MKEPLSPSQRKMLEGLASHPLRELGREYLRGRGLLDVAEELRFGEITEGRYAGRLTIPHFSARGTIVQVAMRDLTGTANAKYLYPAGIDTRLYGLDRLASAGNVIHICEGQPDAATLVACGLPSVGIPGVNGWPSYGPRLFAGYEQVYFWAQSDDKGQSEGLGERIRSGVKGVSVIMVVDGEDLNSFYVKHGKQAVLDLLNTDDSPEGEIEDDGHYDDLGEEIPF